MRPHQYEADRMNQEAREERAMRQHEAKRRMLQQDIEHLTDRCADLRLRLADNPALHDRLEVHERRLKSLEKALADLEAKDAALYNY